MKTQQIILWGPRSTSYWLTALVAVGIILLGLRFILTPNAGAEGFGIPLPYTSEAIAYGWIKGIRDIFSGIVVLIFLFLRKPSATAIAFGAAIIIPVSDFFTILSINGVKDVSHLLIHGATAVYMILTTILLFKAVPKN
jgi:hypothetical protein